MKAGVKEVPSRKGDLRQTGNLRCRRLLSPRFSRGNEGSRAFDKRGHGVKGSFLLAPRYFLLHLQVWLLVNGHLQTDVWLRLGVGCGCDGGGVWSEEHGAWGSDLSSVTE